MENDTQKTTETRDETEVISPFAVVGVAALAIVFLRMVAPNVLFDNQSLILCGIAAVAFLLPRLVQILPPLKALKFKGFEAEFENKINHFADRVVAAEINAESKAQTPSPSGKSEWNVPPMKVEYVTAYRNLVATPVSNREKILSAAILAEQMVLQTAQDLGVKPQENKKTATALVTDLHQKGMITEVERAGFLEFWEIRNAVIHGRVSPTDGQTARVLDLLWRLVRTLA